MTLFALALVLGAAFLHATWNLFAKRVAGQLPFIFLVCVVSSLLWAPVACALVLLQRPQIGLAQLAGLAGSAVLHLGYFALLQRGYRMGELSMVYPLARSTGPVLSSAAAVVLFGERPSVLAGAGMVLIVAGMLVLAAQHDHPVRRPAGAGWAMRYGLFTGVFIAAYTLWDAHAVRALGVPPLVLDWGSNVGRVLLLLPFAGHWRADLATHWHEHRAEVFAVALLGTLAYMLVLTAMTFTPVSYVAVARESSILIGTWMGMRFLSEGGGLKRIVATVIMVAGVAALALG